MRSVTIASAVSAAFLFAACASGGGGEDRPRAGDRFTTIQTGQAATPGFRLRLVDDIVVYSDTVSVPPDELWPSLTNAYLELEIPVTTFEPENRLLGAVEARLRGRVGDARLSRYLRCGQAITGDIADQSEAVYLTALTQILPAGTEASESVVTSHVTAVAVQAGYAGSDVRCTTRGQLEKDILQRMMLEYGRSLEGAGE